MIVLINIRWQDRTIDYSMDLDSNCPTDYAVLHYLDRGQPCEPECVHVMLRALKEGDIAVDGGANIGFFTLLMSKLVGATGKVFAFEPGKHNLSKLLVNLELNGCKNVTVIDKALWSSLEEVPFVVYEDGGSNSIFGEGKSSQVDGVVLDHVVWNYRVRLAKLDIEGAEVEALRGSRRQLRGGMLLLTELNEAALERADTSVKALRELLDQKDCFMLSTTGHFPVYVPPDIDMVIPRMNTNVLFCEMWQIKKLWPEAQVWYD